jgi:hypothetical protein
MCDLYLAIQNLIGQYNLMCDLHLPIHIFLYVYIADPDNAATKS